MPRAHTRFGASVRLLALVLLALLASPAAAWAHAALQSANPAPGSVNAAAPDRIGLIFNEPVQLLSLRLIDAAGREHSPASAPDVRDGQVLWPLPDRLPDGRYLVSWRISSLDGHIIGGTFTFAVGAAVGTPPAVTTVDENHGPVLALHAVARLFLLLAVGTALFRLLLAPQGMAPALHRATRWLAVAGVATLSLFVGAEGALRVGLPITGLLSGDAMRAAFGASNMPLRGLSALGMILLALNGGRLWQGFGIACAIAGMGDSGHVLAVLPSGVGQGLMMLHGFAAALWIGAIAPLRSALTRDAGTETLVLFRRFQSCGAWAMAATLASGLVLAWLLLPRLADLWQSDYGLRLTAKLAAVAAMLAIAGVNRLWLTRRALGSRPQLRGVLSTTLELDLIAAILATVLAVGLSIGPPPAATLDHAIADDAYAATLSFSPGKVGDNHLVIALRAKAGAPLDPKEVQLRLSAPGIETIARKAERIATGRYEVRDLPLWLTGPWQVEIGLLIDDFTRRRLRTELTLAP
ncbi:MAG TPA: copper resistance protein CopC [Dongiaceae bacterium]|nr:copper resistance protein CopC [Dongiaceae bacterium]